MSKNKPSLITYPVGKVVEGNGMTEEQRERLMSLAGKYKDNPESLERMMEGVREFRQKIQEEVERELAEAKEAERSEESKERKKTMATITEQTKGGANGSSVSPAHTGKITEEERQAILSIVGKYKDNPAYVEQLHEEVHEVRQKIQEEVERRLAEDEARSK